MGLSAKLRAITTDHVQIFHNLLISIVLQLQTIKINCSNGE